MRHLRIHKNKIGFLRSVNIDSSRYSIMNLKGGRKRWDLFTKHKSVLSNGGVVLRVIRVQRGFRGGIEVVFQLVIGRELGPVAVYWISSIHDVLLSIIISRYHDYCRVWYNPLYWLLIILLSPVWMYWIVWKWIRGVND